ncbi:MAG TPA: dihydroorotase [Acidobacteriaceae bacterium]|nr:dihydroorotase [Acidobacteriaceae bacterium]
MSRKVHDRILIKGGHLVDPANRIDAPRDLLIEDGRVVAVDADLHIDSQNAEVVDATGLIVTPGFVDIHVHLREPGQSYKETIASGTAAAAAGGFTSVAAMPNTVPVNDSAEITQWMQAPERGAHARVYPIGAATTGSMGKVLANYEALRDAGAIAVSDDGKPILGDETMRAVLRAATALGLPVIQHAEDTRMTGGCSMNAGALAFRLGLRGMPIEAEAGIVARDIALLRELNDDRAHLHVAHLSTKKALDHVRAARKGGLHVTCEVTPHHFTLTEEAVGEYDTHAKMNPPLRAAEDRDSMIEGLLDGTIDCIATDHAPHAAHEKEQEFERAPNGITGLETSLGLSLAVLHRQHGMPLAQVFALLSARPAAVLGIRAGSLAVGASADLVLLAPEMEWAYRASESRSRSRNTPFDGWSLPGKIQLTMRAGRVVHAGPGSILQG